MSLPGSSPVQFYQEETSSVARGCPFLFSSAFLPVSPLCRGAVTVFLLFFFFFKLCIMTFYLLEDGRWCCVYGGGIFWFRKLDS